MTRDLLIREIESLFSLNPAQRRWQNGLSATDYEFEAATTLRLPAVHFKRTFEVVRGSEKNRGSQLNEPGQPAFRDPETATADPQVLLNIVDWLDVENALRYRPVPGGSTWCNIYAYDFCTFAGAYLPHVWWINKKKMPTPQQIAEPILKTKKRVEKGLKSDITELSANSVFDWFKVNCQNFGWEPAVRSSDFTQLQNWANEGHVIVLSRKRSGPGHLLMVIPESDKKRAERNGTGVVTIPVHSQAGRTNFAYRTKNGNAGLFNKWSKGDKKIEIYVKKLQSNGSD